MGRSTGIAPTRVGEVAAAKFHFVSEPLHFVDELIPRDTASSVGEENSDDQGGRRANREVVDLVHQTTRD